MCVYLVLRLCYPIMLVIYTDKLYSCEENSIIVLYIGINCFIRLWVRVLPYDHLYAFRIIEQSKYIITDRCHFR